jgi:hypothetical protein
VGSVIRRPPFIHQHDAALVEQKKRPRFPEPLKETNTDTGLMHNVCDQIGTELQQSLERIVDNLEIDLAQFVFRLAQ